MKARHAHDEDPEVHDLQNTIDVLREREQHYRVMTETATDAIITIDADSRMLFVNQAVQKIFGYTAEELLGQDLTMLMPESMRAAHSASLNRYVCTGEKHIPWDGVELPGLHKNGRIVPLEISFAASTASNRPTFTGIIRDISARKRVEEALRHSEERYRSMYDDNPSMYFTVDSQGVVLSVNQFGAQHLGYAVDELVGRPGLSVIHPDDRAEAHEKFVACMQKRILLAHWEVRKIRKDGSLIWAKEIVRIVRRRAKPSR